MSGEVFTVGHSNLSFEEFTALLEDAGVAALVDVRKLPGSRKYPWFDQENLEKELPARGISYRRSEGLTGRRKVSKTVPFDVNGNWRNRSFHNYADHALGEEFAHALDELCDGARTNRTAIMCSEAVWWRCHRRIIADHLIARGVGARHIMGRTSTGVTINDATLNDGAVIGDDHLVRYPQQD